VSTSRLDCAANKHPNSLTLSAAEDWFMPMTMTG
jgi:hypothetical protein